MKVLVTGGAGFIGSNLCRSLVQSNQVSEVRVIDDLSTGNLANLDGVDVGITIASILDVAALDKAMDGVDSVVHLGAIPSVPRSLKAPINSHEANATGTLNVLELARSSDIDQVIVASSSSVYGSNPKLPKAEDDWTRPLSPYGVSKLATEGYALAYQSSYGLNALAFRFFNVYGPGQAAGHAYAAVIPKFIDAALSNEPLEIHGDGTQSRDFTFVDSVCSVIRAAVERKIRTDSPVNLAFSTNTTLLELIHELEEVLGVTLPRRYATARKGDVKASQADSTLLRELFPDIEPTPLATGLQSTLDWYRGLGR